MKIKDFSVTGAARIYVFLTAALAILILLLITSCGGGGGSEGDGGGSNEPLTAVTPLGIEFRHMGLYSPDELAGAVQVVDDYYGLVVNCVIDNYPDLEDEVHSLSPSDISIHVLKPTLYDPQTGKEGFSCKYYETGCSGSYNVGGAINVTPALDALGHEMGHWMNYMLLGSTRDGDPGDLSALCNITSICHLYSQSRGLKACRTAE